jgi:hypothetical protein
MVGSVLSGAKGFCSMRPFGYGALRFHLLDMSATDLNENPVAQLVRAEAAAPRERAVITAL